MRIKKGDTVKVLSGNDKGKTGEILEVIPKTEKIILKITFEFNFILHTNMSILHYLFY